LITVDHITKRYPSVVALDDVSLEIRTGEFFGLLGPNGAGKTTLMSLLVGYFNAEAGSIVIDGERIHIDNLEVRKRIGFVPQSLALYEELSAQENLEIFGSVFATGRRALEERIAGQLTAVGLYDRRKDKVRTFSGGMKRRLNLIASLLHEPAVLLCDEPTVGVDPQSRNAIFDFLTGLNRQGTTIIYTTHYMEEAERLCSRIGIIDHGKIIALGTLDELLERVAAEETIQIRKNDVTRARVPDLGRFGRVSEEADAYILRPMNGFTLSAFFQHIEAAGIRYQWIELHRPTLEALFLQLTGRRLRD
jgi:ABC-2 type transport system ATP-binding protein